MSDMESPRASRRPRREFTEEFKAGAVRLVLDEGKSMATVARELDLGPSALRGWVEQARADRSHGHTGPTDQGSVRQVVVRGNPS